MRLLDKEYSERLQALWKSLSPPPEVCPYPEELLKDGREPRFAGMHLYHPTTGDRIWVVAGTAHEYTVAHELMHVVLRREGYPHFTFRTFRQFGLDFGSICLIVQLLESAVLHPNLNRRLFNMGIQIPPEYCNGLVEKQRQQLGVYELFLQMPTHLPIFYLLLVEMVMWKILSEEELRAKLNFPEAWKQAEIILQMAGNLEVASPAECRKFALKVVRIMEDFLQHEKGVYSKSILFPPPPFLGDPQGPAREQFAVHVENYKQHGYEVEVSALLDGMLCWTDGPLAEEQARNQELLIGEGFNRLRAEDFADYCDRLLIKLIAQ